MDKNEKQKAHFETIARKYLNARQNENHQLLKKLIWNEFLKSKIINKNNEKKKCYAVLEPMCGYAEGYDILVSHLGSEIKYTGFDSSETLVKYVRLHNPWLEVNIKDITKFEGGCAKYDIIILIGGLHHVFEYSNKILENLSEVLNPGGVFINFEPTDNNRLVRKIRNIIYKKNNLFDHETEKAFKLTQLNQLFEANNYRLVDQIYPGLLSYILYYNPDAFPYLNLGGKALVEILFNLDKKFFRNWIGQKFSFATLSMWQKENEHGRVTNKI